jgi:transposase InsO family protein
MTMTLADAARLDDVVVNPRADQPKRRMFTAEYKARILDEYDTADRGTYYNHEHRHSGIGLHTPASVCRASDFVAGPLCRS